MLATYELAYRNKVGMGVPRNLAKATECVATHPHRNPPPRPDAAAASSPSSCAAPRRARVFATPRRQKLTRLPPTVNVGNE